MAKVCHILCNKTASLDFIQEYVGFTGPHGISES